MAILSQKEVNSVRCYHCQYITLGVIGPSHYYCAECCFEFKVKGAEWFGYMIDEEGDVYLAVSSREEKTEDIQLSQVGD